MNYLQTQFESISILKDLAVPAAAAWVAFWLATKKFKRERIWQEKYTAYQRVLESVEAIRYWGNETYSAVHMLPIVGHDSAKSAQQHYAEAKREVAKQSAIGTILLSNEFVLNLSEFQKEVFQQTFDASEDLCGDEQDRELAYGTHAAKVRDIADKYLLLLIAAAWRDLRD